MTNDSNGKLQTVNILLTLLISIALVLSGWVLKRSVGAGERLTRLESFAEVGTRCTGERCDALDHRLDLLEKE